MRTRGCSHSIILGLALCLLMVLLTQPSLAGTYCGSESGIGRVFKETSPDWWPDLMLVTLSFWV